MGAPWTDEPDLPEYMTWDELEQLPEQIAEQIELWDGRVVWVRREPAEHQTFTYRMTAAIERCTRKAEQEQSAPCLRTTLETNVFLGRSGKSDFLTPDFLVHRCLESPYQDIRASDTVLVGEVLSPSNTQSDMEAKKGRYASAGIPWYWEVTLARRESAIATIRAYALESKHGELPDGVHPLRPANYLVAGEWTHDDEQGVQFDFPFRIDIPWTDLQY
ncbi:Uma2 family endonuclease [Nocardia carnea]|uniref:Uma2 family endonuclease n=1 Tax=Nocardia carnea TaxID=37328 RepID=UPI0024541E65|nr:Uma2 family endonuclease [Nocardia carnea]